MKHLLQLLTTVLIMMSVVACNNRPRVVAPFNYVSNRDSLKTYVDKAALTNDPKDQFCAAEYYLRQYTSTDSIKAIELLLKSASQNFPWAANCLGNIYSKDSTNSYYDIKKAVEYYELGANNGADRAMTNLANLYINGEGVKPDYKKAMQLRTDAILGLLELAQKGDASAQQRLGVNLADGIGVPENEKAGYEWIKKSADQGYTPAQYGMGICYQYGYGGVKKDTKEAFEYYLKAANKGDEAALYRIAQCYKDGIGVENDLSKAFEYYLRTAELGNIDAMFEVALCYQNGYGTTTNHKEAFKWYKKCAERGNLNAYNNIGAMYSEGEGVTQDDKEAFRWFMKAAEAGNAFSQRVVGDFYYDGKGVEKDKTKAFEWYMKAAKEGDKIGMNRVARCYLLGEGVVKDDKLVTFWFDKSK
ncbi:MAG: sel1 repeat family protein [Bacteroidaceae bacterium]|nr:sel1 repeat family protein [Bacteroidaceae bacterium]